MNATMQRTTKSRTVGRWTLGSTETTAEQFTPDVAVVRQYADEIVLSRDEVARLVTAMGRAL